MRLRTRAERVGTVHESALTKNVRRPHEELLSKGAGAVKEQSQTPPCEEGAVRIGSERGVT